MKRAFAFGTLLLVVAGCRADGQALPARAEGDQVANSTTATAGGELEIACEVVAGATRTLPDEIRETSGLARGRADARTFWTHNDAGGEAELFALDADGGLVGRVRLTGAEARDWEDIEAGRCAAGSCLYVGDIGDNDGEREVVTVYEVPEPDPGAAASLEVTALPARYPDGKWDAEALFLLPDGGLYIVTKGRRGPIALYRYPTVRAPGETVVLERVRELFGEPEDNDDRVTSASASPDGRWVGIRTYRALYLYPAADLVGGDPVTPAVIDLKPLDHPQGESFALSDEGQVWLSSEAENARESPLWSRMVCSLPVL